MIYREALLRAATVCESEKNWAGLCRLHLISGHQSLLSQASVILTESAKKEHRQLGRWLARELKTSKSFTRKFPKFLGASEEERLTIRLLFVKRCLERCCEPSLQAGKELETVFKKAKSILQDDLSAIQTLDPTVYSDIQWGLAVAYTKLERPEKARFAIGEALKMRRRKKETPEILALRCPIRVRAYRLLGNHFSDLGQFHLALKARKLELEMLEEAAEREISLFNGEKAILLSVGCNEFLELSRYQEALAWSNCSVHQFEKHHSTYSQNLYYVQAIVKGGLALWCLGEIESGLQRISVGIGLWEELEQKAPNSCVEHLAWTCHFLGRHAIINFPYYIEGRLNLKKSVFFYAKLAAASPAEFGEQFGEASLQLAELARQLTTIGEVEEAKSCYDQFFEIHEMISMSNAEQQELAIGRILVENLVLLSNLNRVSEFRHEAGRVLSFFDRVEDRSQQYYSCYHLVIIQVSQFFFKLGDLSGIASSVDLMVNSISEQKKNGGEVSAVDEMHRRLMEGKLEACRGALPEALEKLRNVLEPDQKSQNELEPAPREIEIDCFSLLFLILIILEDYDEASETLLKVLEMASLAIELKEHIPGDLRAILLVSQMIRMNLSLTNDIVQERLLEVLQNFLLLAENHLSRMGSLFDREVNRELINWGYRELSALLAIGLRGTDDEKNEYIWRSVLAVEGIKTRRLVEFGQIATESKRMEAPADPAFRRPISGDYDESLLSWDLHRDKMSRARLGPPKSFQNSAHSKQQSCGHAEPEDVVGMIDSYQRNLGKGAFGELRGDEFSLITRAQIQGLLDTTTAAITILSGRDFLAFVLITERSVNLRFLSSKVLEESIDRVKEWWDVLQSDRQRLQEKESSQTKEEYFEDASRIFDVLDPICEQLLKPLVALIPGSVKKLLLSTDSYFGPLPIYSYPLEGGGSLSEQFEVCVTPSLEVLELCRKRSYFEKGVVVFSNPTEDLDYAELEGAAVWQGEEKVLRLEGAQVTRSEFLNQVSRSGFVHYCGHFDSDCSDPLSSTLRLCGDESLSLLDILGKSEGLGFRPRIVVLGGCETGLSIGRGREDFTVGAIQDLTSGMGVEAVSLSTAFIIAGAKCTLSSFWVVDDLSSALLGWRFSNLLSESKGEMNPARALRNAIDWLRYEISSGPVLLDKIFPEFLVNVEPSLAAEAQREVAKYAKNFPSSPPFAAPAHWAGYFISGDGFTA